MRFIIFFIVLFFAAPSFADPDGGRGSLSWNRINSSGNCSMPINSGQSCEILIVNGEGNDDSESIVFTVGSPLGAQITVVDSTAVATPGVDLLNVTAAVWWDRAAGTGTIGGIKLEDSTALLKGRNGYDLVRGTYWIGWTKTGTNTITIRVTAN